MEAVGPMANRRRVMRRSGWTMAILGLFATALSVVPVAAQDDEPVDPELPTPRGAVTWRAISSDTGELDPPFPIEGTEQTDSQILDIDRDGINDFVITNRSDAPAGVWFQRTATGWIRHVFEDELLNLEAGGTHHDVDGDGDLDIVVGEDYRGDFIYWWENPYPDFDPAVTWERHEIKNAGTNEHHDIIFGDVDGDGADEFIFWNNGTTLNVAEIPADPKAGPWPFTTIFRDTVEPRDKNEGLAIIDVDLDGVDDIVGGGRWFKYDGGTSYIRTDIDTSLKFSRTAAGQLIPGGRPEIVFVIGDISDPFDGSSRLTVYSWDGTDWVGIDPIGEDSQSAHSLQIEDVNQDGLLDIFVAEMTLSGNDDAKGRILYGDGTGGFEVQDFSVGNDFHQSKIGDLDGDGDIDVLGKPFNGGTPLVNIWLNDGIDLGILPLDQWVRHSVDDNMPHVASHVRWGDLDGDGRLDIVAGGSIYESDPSGDYAEPWSRRSVPAPLTNVALVHDFDGDGHLDLLGTDGIGHSEHPGSVTMYWGHNNGDGTFTVYDNIEPGAASRVQHAFVSGIDIADIDKDGLQEVVVSWNHGEFGDSGMDVFTVPADPINDTWDMTTVSPVSEGEEAPLGDIDGDGDLDIFQGSGWLRNEYPLQEWTRFTVTTQVGNNTPYDDPDRVSLVDVDDDGDLDAVIGLLFENQATPVDLIWLENPEDPTGEWPIHVMGGGIGGGFAMSVGDVDNDGDPDVALGEHVGDARLLIFENIDDATSWTEHEADEGGEGIDHHVGALLVDFDGDGDLDVVSIGWWNQKVWLFENKAVEPGQFSDDQAPTVPTDVTATPTSATTVEVAWTPSTDNRGIREYEIWRDGSPIGTTTGVSFIDSGLTTGITYAYTVIAVDTSGNESAPSSPAAEATTLEPDTEPPTPPASLTAVAGPGRVDLSWSPSSDNRAVAGYRVLRGGVEIASLDGETLSYRDEPLPAETTFTYEVVAFDLDANSSTPGASTASATTPAPPSGLWAAYGFEDDGTDITDSSGNGNDGTLVPNAQLVDAEVSDQALAVDGSVGDVDLGTLDIDSDELTIMAWINADDFDVYDARIVSKSTSTAANDHLWMLSTFRQDSLRFRLRTDDGGGTTTLISDRFILDTGTWHHVTATYDGTTMRLWLDGVEVGSTPKSGSVFTDPTVPAAIGANPGAAGQVFDGRIDDVKIFARALDAAEIATEMDAHVGSVPPDTTPPAVVTDVTATAAGTDAVDVEWNATTDDVAVASYTVRRDGVAIATVPAATTSHRDTGLSPDTTYAYTVTATDTSANTSDPSDPAEATTAPLDTTPPATVTNVNASATGRTTVSVTWAPTTDDDAVASYTVLRDGVPVATVDDATTTFDDTGLSAGGEYAYTVTASDPSANTSPPSDPATATTDPPDTTPPATVTGVTAAATGRTSVTVGWDATSDDEAVATYTVRRDGTPVATVDAATTTFDDTGLTPGTTYAYTIVATDTSANASTPSTAANATTDPPDTTPPATVTGVTAVATGESTVDVDWDATTDDEAVATYTVLRDGTPIATLPADTTSHTDSGLSPNTAYAYTVTATDTSANTSDPSTAANATTDGPDITPPAVVANVTAVAAGRTSIDVGWDATSDDEAVATYGVRRDGTPVATVDAATTSFTDTGLSPGTTYAYTITATDTSANTSDPSDEAEATTDPPDTTPPAPVTGVTAVATGESTVDVDWDATTDDEAVATYTVLRDGTPI
ncbi:MAG: FG-GAP-like repeat-containing protein, partial [Actinomycetota bacterium]